MLLRHCVCALQVLVNYARSAKEAEQVSKQVCDSFCVAALSLVSISGGVSHFRPINHIGR